MNFCGQLVVVGDEFGVHRYWFTSMKRETLLWSWPCRSLHGSLWSWLCSCQLVSIITRRNRRIFQLPNRSMKQISTSCDCWWTSNSNRVLFLLWNWRDNLPQLVAQAGPRSSIQKQDRFQLSRPYLGYMTAFFLKSCVKSQQLDEISLLVPFINRKSFSLYNFSEFLRKKS